MFTPPAESLVVCQYYEGSTLRSLSGDFAHTLSVCLVTLHIREIGPYFYRDSIQLKVLITQMNHCKEDFPGS